VGEMVLRVICKVSSEANNGVEVAVERARVG
jgi:hypothetical protein